MKAVSITCKGSIKDPNDKLITLEKFEFEFDGTEWEEYGDLEDKVERNYVKLQHKIDQLNETRTTYVAKRLAELGYQKPKKESITPEMKALVNKMLDAQKNNPALYAKLSATLDE